MEAVEYAILACLGWFNDRRLLKPIGDIPPAGAEPRYDASRHGLRRQPDSRSPGSGESGEVQLGKGYSPLPLVERVGAAAHHLYATSWRLLDHIGDAFLASAYDRWVCHVPGRAPPRPRTRDGAPPGRARQDVTRRNCVTLRPRDMRPGSRAPKFGSAPGHPA